IEVCEGDIVSRRWSAKGLVHMPEQVEAPALFPRMHLDRCFKKPTPHSITLAKVKKGSIEEQQAVRVLGLPSVVRKVDWLTQCHSVPRSKYTPHSGSILLAPLVGSHLPLKRKDGSFRLPIALHKSTNTTTRFDDATCLMSTKQLN